MSKSTLSSESDLALSISTKTNKDELKLLLRRLSPEAAAVIALRVGFRVVPFVVDQPSGAGFSPKERQEIVSAFRFISFSKLILKYPSEMLQHFSSTLVSSASKRFTSATAAIRECARIAFQLSEYLLKQENRESFSLDNCVESVAYIAMIGALSLTQHHWSAIQSDIEVFRDGNLTALDVLELPLWLGGSIEDMAPEMFILRWISLQTELFKDDKSWRAWTDWYEGIIHGHHLERMTEEFARLTLTSDAYGRFAHLDKRHLAEWDAEFSQNRHIFRNNPRKSNRKAIILINEQRGMDERNHAMI